MPGKKNCTADTLSRYSSLKVCLCSEDAEQEDEVTAAVLTVTVEAMDVVDRMVLNHVSVARAAASDPTYQPLTNRVRARDWPAIRVRELPDLKLFYNITDRLSTDDEVVTYTFEHG